MDWQESSPGCRDSQPAAWAGVVWRSRHAEHRDWLALPAATMPPARLAAPPSAPPSASPSASPPLTVPRSSFVGRDADGKAIEPRRGRFFPGRCLLPGTIATAPRQPFRVREVRPGTLLVDAGPPLAAIALTPVTEAVAPPGWPAALSTLADPLRVLDAAGIGLQAALPDGDTDFFGGAAFARADAGDDRHFYRQPRLVQHIDAAARAVLTEAHRRELDGLPAGAEVLDLMSSWTTHLPPAGEFRLTGLGLNGAELAANPGLRSRLVADLNAAPVLPFADAVFDAAICALSVEYLIDPLAVFAEVGRVLKPGGRFVVSWSERWFPPKVIALWRDLHPYERVALVIDYFRLSGCWTSLVSESRRGLRRPADDRHAGRLAASDPLYRVSGRRIG